jgi:hypothetical protein
MFGYLSGDLDILSAESDTTFLRKKDREVAVSKGKDGWEYKDGLERRPAISSSLRGELKHTLDYSISVSKCSVVHVRVTGLGMGFVYGSYSVTFCHQI